MCFLSPPLCPPASRPSPAETLDQSQQNSCQMCADFRRYPVALAPSGYRDVYLMAPQPGLHVLLWLPSFLRSSAVSRRQTWFVAHPLIPRCVLSPLNSWSWGSYGVQILGSPILCRKEGFHPTSLREHTQGAGRSNSHGVPPLASSK